MRNDAWMLRAACKDLDTDLFYPKGNNPDNQVAAKAICAVCPVSAQCLASVDDLPVIARGYGIYGGLTPKERKVLSKQQ